MNRIFPIGALLWALALPLKADWIQGDGFSYSLDAPIGWVLDRSLAAEAEADLVLYPQGSSYYKADSIITLSSYEYSGSVTTLNDLVQKDKKEEKAANPKMEVQKGPILLTKQLRAAPLYFYSKMKDGGCEAVVYLGEESRVILFVLSCPNLQVLHEDLPALKETVGSYGTVPEKEAP